MAAVVLSLLLGAAVAKRDEPRFAEGRLWRISKAGIDDSYVFGTIHLPDPRVTVIPGKVEAALAHSRTLATEVVIDAVDSTQARELEALAGHGKLEPMVGAATFTALSEKLAAQGTPRDVIAHLKPWAAMMKITRDASGHTSKTLDERIVLDARARRMRVWSLEGIEEQVASFDTIPAESQVALLEYAVAHPDALAADLEPTIQAWQAGDLAALAQASVRVAERYPQMSRHVRELANHIIRDRTSVMHYRLFMPLRQGRVFVAVGAMHLYGDEGLLALLEQDGYRVTRVM